MQNDKKKESNSEKGQSTNGSEDSKTDSKVENSNSQSSVNGNAESQDESKGKKMLKELIQGEDMKFMDNFYPELSNREKRKLNRKFALEGKKSTSVYDEHGVIRSTGKDVCDCLDEKCVGCHFPCPRCRSCKCGQECRVNRKWMYETVENETEKCLMKPDSENEENN